MTNGCRRRREAAGSPTAIPFPPSVRRPVLLLAALALLPFARAAEAAPAAPDPARLARLAETGQPLGRVFAPREYRGHDQVWRIAELPDGRLVFGNLNQVLEFDGLRWRTIPVPGGSYIRALATDATGTVWVAGVDELGRLEPGPDGELAYRSMRAAVPAEVGELGTVWSAFARPDGVWFVSSAAALRWTGERFEAWPIREKGIVLAYPWRDTVIVAREESWSVPRPGGGWEEVFRTQVLPRALWEAPDGRIVVVTGRQGLQTFADGRLQPLPTEADEWLRTKKIYGAHVLPDDRLLVTSLQGGAIVLGPDLRVEALCDDTAGLPSETVIAGHLDRHGGLWLGTDNGVVRLDYASPVRVFGVGHGLGRSGPESIQRVGGRVLVSTARNVLELLPPAALPGNPRLRESEAYSDRVTELARLPDGVLASGLLGLNWISGGKSVKLDGPAGVREVVEVPGEPGRIVATHLNGLASWRRDGEGWRFEGEWPEPRGELRGLVADAAGALWTSTPNAGVVRFEPARGEPRAARLERFAEDAGLPVDRRLVALGRVGGAPLFKTQQGFHRYDPVARRFRPETGFGARFADGSTYVRLSAEDRFGGLWMAVEPREDRPAEILYGRDGRWERLPLPDLDRLGTFNFLTWEEAGGRELLWLGGQTELRRVDLTAWRERPPPSPGRTLLRAVQAGRGRALAPGGQGVELRAAENTLRFAFATPGLGGEPQALHESRLVGFADGEAQTGAAGERTFTNLPAGAYTFEVRGRSADGRWSEPARFAFTVLAPWWQTPWAVAGYLISGSVGLFAYIRWRIRRLTRERRRLEAVIAERTAELARQNVELERLHRLDQDEKLAARLAEEKAQLELLRYQLNPHFLYNSLNSIRALVFTNGEAAAEMVTRLSEFCRWTLTRTSDGMTTVAEEVEMLQAYLDIERTRWQESLRARIDVDPAARELQIPQFLFLPLLENAIKYGGRTSPDLLEIATTIKVEDDHLVCQVANTGQWVRDPGPGGDGDQAESTRIGLDNLRQRLARYYGPDRRPEVVTMPGWVCVRLSLPRHPARRGSASPV